jgi:phosphatidylglycerophosphate synthase
MTSGRVLAIGRHAPNVISAARLMATPVLAGAMIWNRDRLFTWLLLACLLSDIVDGAIARAFRLQSALGAFLDSTADMIVLVLTAAALWRFQSSFVAAHGVAIASLLALYFAEVAGALWRYGRISSFHTTLSRVAAYAQGIFVMSLFLWGYQAWIFRLMVGVSALSLSEELVLLMILPTWRPDVRGLYWIWAKS